MEYNKIPIVFIGRKGTAPPISYQYDKKQVGVMEGVYGLPDVFTVDFCNDGDTVTKPVICTPESINIPDEYLITGRTIIGYFWLSGPNGSAEPSSGISGLAGRTDPLRPDTISRSQ